MNALVNIDGRIVDERRAMISVFDHGFLYGEGVYETLRTYRRLPFLFGAHAERLRASADAIALSMPLSATDLFGRILETQSERPGTDDSYIRVMLTRGIGELTYDPAACATPTLIIIVKPHIDPPTKQFTEGVRVALVSVVRNFVGSVHPRIKSNNLLNNALAMQEAMARGASEALMRNYRGEIVECSQSNFFIVKNDEILTPSLECGLLAGITRKFVIDLALGLHIPVREAILSDRDVLDADEAFLTSTTREITPVVQVDEHTIGPGRPGAITASLLIEYRRRAIAASM